MDEETGNYFFTAPKLDAMSRFYFYFLFFKGSFYEIVLRSYSKGDVEIKDFVCGDVIDELKEEIKEVFLIYGLHGCLSSQEVNFKG